MAENASGLDLDRRHLSDGLHVEAVVGEFVTDFVVISNDHDLDDDLWDGEFQSKFKFEQIPTHIRLLLSPEASVERIQFTDGEEALLEQFAQDVQ